MSVKLPRSSGPDLGNEAAEEGDEHFLPPRKVVHPAERDKWLRVFYRSLLWLLIALTVSLLFWGWSRMEGL